MQMSAEPLSSSPSAFSSSELITSVNHNDVLMGRGSGPNDFVGNLRFRSIIEQRKEDYRMASFNKAKKNIVRNVFDHVHALGGRFLKEVETDTPVRDVEVEERVWIEVKESVALQKCRQALRDQNRGRLRSQVQLPHVDSGLPAAFSPAGSISRGMSQDQEPAPLPIPPSASFTVQQQAAMVQLSPPLPSHLMPFLPLMIVGNSEPGVVDARYSLVQEPLFAHQQQTTMVQPMATNHANLSYFKSSVQNQSCIGITPDMYPLGSSMSQDQYLSGNSDAIAARKRCLDNSALFSRLQVTMPWQTDSVSAVPKSGCNVATTRSSMSETDVSAAASESDLSDFLLSLLILDRPMITEEQVELERAAMTDEERAEALTDLFGSQCAVDTHNNKRARRDLDKSSIDFFVHQMRLELDRIPENEKRALVEAQTKCLADEFSDARLERFLRCEGMNVKQGARRFVNYWESRREVFGDDKFVLPMTLGEALCDDLAAVEACVLSLLPHLDASGRQLLLSEPCRHTRDGYTSESMLCAVWYIFEAMAQENRDMDSSFVLLVNMKDMTMWDFDYRLYSRIVYFDKTCWPLKRVATHICFPPRISVKYIVPIFNGMHDKHIRSRKLVHDVPESQLLDVLSDYGICKEMLPTEMGGTFRLNQSEWIARQRALELKEI